VPCRIVDKAPAPNPDSRATDMQTRTLEVLHDMGLVDEALALGHPHRNLALHGEGRWLARLSLESVDSPYPFSLAITQDRTEAMLARHLERIGGRLERCVEVSRVEPHDDGATATLLLPDGRWEKMPARWVVGCDGASSAVRIGLGLPFEGTSYEERFLMADVRLKWDHPADTFYIFYGDAAFTMVIPLPDDRVRLFMNEPPGDHAVDIATFRELFRDCVPFPAELDDPGWMSRFRMHKRMVPRYRVGHVFLAGDAAHIHSPISGQGMNLGMQDAYNLAWKLALVARGRAPESLLDSYEPERRPLAAAVLEDADRSQRMAMFKEGLRSSLRSLLFDVLARFPSAMKARTDKASQVAFHYRDSPIVSEVRGNLLSTKLREDPTREEPTFRDWLDFSSAPNAGDRAPDLSLGDGSTLFERLRGTHHTVLLFDGRAPTSEGYGRLAEIARAAQVRWGDLVRPIVVVYGDNTPPQLASAADGCVLHDAGGELHSRYGAGAECLYAIRPDGYVGFRSQPADGAALEAALGRVLL
jgi:2-polyprenyl-6-methoxyphenol hydroxylase-like FAD-dependent oxidoreductase